MKKIVILLLAISTSFANAQSGLLNGTGSAPDFTVTDIIGNSHTVYNYLDSGYVMVLELMSVTCGHCQAHAAGTENSYQTNGPNGNNSARFLGLEINATTDAAAVVNFINTFGASFPIANDVSPSAINYQLTYTPTYYVIYPDRSYTTICANCITSTSSSTIEGLLDNAIASWPPVYGCTDDDATNYNPNATTDDGSCDFTSYDIKTLGMTFSPDTLICDVGDTINFILGQSHNAVEIDQSTFLSGGNTSNGGFSFGYGVTDYFIPTNAQTYYYVCQPHAAGGMVGMIIANIYGCTDSLAVNYDPTATVDNDSCDYTSYTITTVGMSFSPDTIHCDVGDTINFILGGYHNAVEVSDSTWLAGGNTSNAGFSFGYGATGMFIPEECHTFYYVCQPHASLGMKGVIVAHHTAVYGCTDSLAVNYDSLATINDSSCYYTDLFISEYAEGSSYNKYIEIYNGTGVTIDLGTYEIWKITNGGSWPESSFILSGSLSDGEVYVIAHSSADSSILVLADTVSGICNFNGDDAVGLANNGNLIDAIGMNGADPGAGWDVAGENSATKDQTLVRKCNITSGNTDWILSAGTDSLSSEWLVYSQNDWTDLGVHFSCNTIISGCTDILATNYDATATIDDGSCIYPMPGCMDPTAINYNPSVTVDDGSCIYDVYGCTGPTS